MLEKLPAMRNAPAAPARPAPPPVAQPYTGQQGVTPGMLRAEAPLERPQKRRRRYLQWSALVCVGLPTLLAGLYYALIAADQYAVEVRFAVRSNSSSASSGDVFGAFSGFSAPGSTMADSYIVIDYMKSRELVDKLDKKIALKKIYSTDRADWFARFNPSLSVEELLEYWRHMIKASFDNMTQIVAIEVRAFTAEDAKTVATAVLEQSEQLINDLSTRARDDAVKSAQGDVKRMEELLKKNRGALSIFRDTKEEFDPVKQVEARYSILSKLEEQLSASKTKMASLKAFMGDEAPSVTVLKSEIKAIERQVEEERSKLGSKKTEAGQQSLGGLIANYEELLVDREFSEKAYTSALSSLERARADADRQQRYLAAFVRPTLPEEAIYPQRILGTLTVLALASLLWALGVLVSYAIRDHAL